MSRQTQTKAFIVQGTDSPHASNLYTPVPLLKIPPSSSLPGSHLLQEAYPDPSLADCFVSALSCSPSEAQVQSGSHVAPDLNPGPVIKYLRDLGEKMPTRGFLGGWCKAIAVGNVRHLQGHAPASHSLCVSGLSTRLAWALWGQGGKRTCKSPAYGCSHRGPGTGDG